MRDGNFITITNRVPDLPDWFDLHPLEVSGSLTNWMMKRLKEGYQPQEPVDGPNLWRVPAGDRLAWVGPKRAGACSEDGVLEVVEFEKNALVYGEPFEYYGKWPVFGGFDQGELSPEATRLCRAGWDAISGLGFPRTVGADGQWRIG